MDFKDLPPLPNNLVAACYYQKYSGIEAIVITESAVFIFDLRTNKETQDKYWDESPNIYMRISIEKNK